MTNLDARSATLLATDGHRLNRHEDSETHRGHHHNPADGGKKVHKRLGHDAPFGRSRSALITRTLGSPRERPTQRIIARNVPLLISDPQFVSHSVFVDRKQSDCLETAAVSRARSRQQSPEQGPPTKANVPRFGRVGGQNQPLTGTRGCSRTRERSTSRATPINKSGSAAADRPLAWATMSLACRCGRSSTNC